MYSFNGILINLTIKQRYISDRNRNPWHIINNYNRMCCLLKVVDSCKKFSRFLPCSSWKVALSISVFIHLSFWRLRCLLVLVCITVHVLHACSSYIPLNLRACSTDHLQEFLIVFKTIISIKEACGLHKAARQLNGTCSDPNIGSFHKLFLYISWIQVGRIFINPFSCYSMTGVLIFTTMKLAKISSNYRRFLF